ncbi:MAG: hypothetical protein GX660_23045, partial [Clostridiaceae bacterium]|nr:hypothetical protein [Clostridiaceae bacterium]
MTRDRTGIKAAEDSFGLLEKYCRLEEYKGWDPYDGLNSKVFKGLPFLMKSDIARLAWIQLFKRSPVNLRRLCFVPKGHNPKGNALLISGYCNLFRRQALTGKNQSGSGQEL